MAKRIQNQKEEERVVSMSRPAAMNLSSFFIATSSSTASGPIVSKSLGMPTALGKPDSSMSVEPSSFDAASTSQMRLKDAYLGGFMEKQRGDPSHQEEEDSEDSDNPEAETWYYQGEPVAHNSKAWEHGASFSVDKSKGYRSDMEPLSPNITEQIPLYGSRLLHGQENLWKTTWRSYERFECEFGYLENVHEHHSSSSGHLGKDYDTNMRFVKNYLWKTTGQLFRETEKLISGQTETTGISLINFEDLRLGIDKLIAQSSLSIFHCQSLCLLRLSALFGENGRQSC